jgi:hypothetical protein
MRSARPATRSPPSHVNNIQSIILRHV